MKLLWFTDLHIGAKDEMPHGVDSLARFEHCFRSAIAAHPNAQRVIFTGDLAHRGNGAAYPEVARILAGSSLLHRAIPGNHDNAQHMHTHLHGGRGIAVEHWYRERLDDWDLLYLNTHVEGNRPGLDPQQIEWVAQQLEASRTRPVLLFLHHPPFPTGIPAIDSEGFENGDRLRQLLDGAGPVHLLAGHCHRTIAGNWAGTPFTALAGTHLSFELELDTPHLVRCPSDPEYAVLVADPESIAVHFVRVPFGTGGQAR